MTGPKQNFRVPISAEAAARFKNYQLPNKLDTLTKVYPSQGKCLLCLKTYDEETKPTKEHVIARCLSKNGETYIVDGTCEKCNSDMNTRFENWTFQHHLAIARAKLGLKRRDKKRPIVPHPVAMGVPETYEDFDTEINVDDYPNYFQLIVTERAGRLVREDRSKGFRYFRVVTVPTGPINPAQEITTHTSASPWHFGLTLCKMAYLYACAERGIDNGFDGSEMRALLKGESDDLFNYFGNASPLFYPRRDYLHELYLREFQGHLTVVVALFSSLGIPPYEVVVGKLVKP